MKPHSIKPAHRRNQSAPRRTCIVSDSGGHQSASGGSPSSAASGPACGFAGEPRNRPPSPLTPRFSPPNHQLTSPSRIPCPPSRRRHCSSCTYPTENPRVYGILLIMRYKPNFQTSRLTVTLDMIRTYNENCPKKHKKSKPNPNPIQTRSKPNTNPISKSHKLSPATPKMP